MYQSLSGSISMEAGDVTDPGHYKQGPKPLKYNRLGVSAYATIPAPMVIQDPSSEVIINQTGSYAFLYGTSGSVGETANLVGSGWITGSVALGTDEGSLPVKLEINARAWKRTSAAVAGGGGATGETGEVTFIYKGR